jgi:Lrp/AsnC family transcriptional regulator, regulator for asnA, asnC and gidA
MTIHQITGQYDIATVVVAYTIFAINSYIDEIRKIEGVSDNNNVIVLSTLGNYS